MNDIFVNNSTSERNSISNLFNTEIRKCKNLSSEQIEFLIKFNNTEKLSNRNETVSELFENQALKTPTNVALEFHGEKLTYGELNRKVNQLARLLRVKNVKPDTIVGIIIKPCFEMIIGILAIIKAGGAYLPIDPEYPYERINYMLNDSKVKILLTDHYFSENEFKTEIINLREKSLYENNNSELDIINKSSDLLYLIYTSGSTGKPKGVMIEHKAINNLILGIKDVIGFSAERTILLLTTMSFDIFALELFVPLTQGMKIVIADEFAQKNPKLIDELILSTDVDMLQITPSRLQLILNYNKNLSFLKRLKCIMIGGEVLPISLLEEVKTLTDARIFNMYGPTETTVWSMISEIKDNESVSIGKPIANTQVIIVNDNNNIVSVGEEGELCISGLGLSRGYLNNDDLTKEKFIDNPYIPDKLMYRTGDIAKWLPSGNVAFVGRKDRQIKISGRRIELEEIEHKINSNSNIKYSAVIVKENSIGNKVICAYCVLNNKIEVNSLKVEISKFLPYYMIPSHFYILNELPLTPNGKIDRNALYELEIKDDFHMESNKNDFHNGIESSTVETRIKEIIEKYVSMPSPFDQKDILCDLVSLGIDSITFIKVIAAIENEFGFEFGDEELEIKKYPNLLSLISYVKFRLK